jgi:TonB family protein
MKHMTRLLVKVSCMIFATLAVSLPALAMTNEESARVLKLTEFVLPVYPDLARQAGFASGTVTVVIAHDGSGRPTDMLVLDSSHPGFTEAVQNAVNRWRFEPDAAAGTMQAPAVRFYFSSKGVVLLQSSGLQGSLANNLLPDKLQFLTFNALDAPPKALEQPMPVFPQALRGRVNSGTARVSFFVDETGHARAAVVTEASSPEFAEAALAAVGQWRYEAPRQNGRPVVAVGDWNFRFAGPSGS